MVEPVTVNKALIVPNTGDLPGTWGSAALNPDYVAIDGMLGGFQVFTLTTGTTTLTVPAGFVATPSPGPTQSQNALLTLSGTLTGNCTIVFPMPGFYIVENICTVGAFYIKLQSPAPGNVVCAPPGEAVHVFNDGVNMRYVNLGRVGSYLDDCGTAVPAWISNCTVPPYLLCDGSTFSAATYPALAAKLGGTTLPDSLGRIRATLNGGTTRITTAGSGIDGDTRLSAGGVQNVILESTQVPATSITTGNVSTGSFTFHGVSTYNSTGGSPGIDNIATSGFASQVNISAQTVTGQTVQGGGLFHQNMPPAYIGGITMIRAA